MTKEPQESQDAQRDERKDKPKDKAEFRYPEYEPEVILIHD